MADFNPAVEYADLDQDIRAMAERIKRDFSPEVIVAVGRGGLIPASMIAHQMDLRQVRTLDLHYVDDVLMLRTPYIVEGKFTRILVVDDISDTGKTLQWISDAERTLFYCGLDAPKVRYFSVFRRDGTMFEPEYCLYNVENKDYLHFPWDYDGREEEIPF